MDDSGRLLHGWPIFAASYISYSLQGIDLSVPWNRPPNDRLYQCGIDQFINPSMPGPRFDENGYGLSHIAGNIHVLPICRVKAQNQDQFDWKNAFRKSNHPTSFSAITDGTSNTLLIGTAAEQFKPWGHPANLRDPALGINRHPTGFGGPQHWRGALMLMCDGSVRFFSNDTDPQIMKALGTPAGGESLEGEIAGP